MRASHECSAALKAPSLGRQDRSGGSSIFFFNAAIYGRLPPIGDLAMSSCPSETVSLRFSDIRALCTVRVRPIRTCSDISDLWRNNKAVTGFACGLMLKVSPSDPDFGIARTNQMAEAVRKLHPPT